MYSRGAEKREVKHKQIFIYEKKIVVWTEKSSSSNFPYRKNLSKFYFPTNLEIHNYKILGS